ncbi:hypothetical protein C8A00DRAFT_18663 [Chaetomidium leptoderma]|uniref:Rhodopsin domain-containing protein n=1 Tax=Chaetomidium leptoderma TaxID=669021 RepID=A0AAN6VDW8_9PEZI|nr:hypothetical protein C8A00DRAFT_18663 [Chaetomidium leptoderma]
MSRADESRAGSIATAIILSPAIAAVTVALRVYTRRVLVGVQFFEDYCIVGAMVFSITMSAFMGTSVIYGFGRHIETVSSAELVGQAKVAIGGIVFYILTHMALKLSILLQYVRISVMPFEKRLCYALIAILITQSLTVVGIHLGLCMPFHALWTPNVKGAVCLDRMTVYYAQLGITIAMDVLVLVAPLFILRHLSLPWIQKFLILIVLSFGGMACIISVLRLLTVVASTQSKDSTYDKVGSALYGVIEPNLGIFCACIVTLRPLFNRVAPELSQRLSLTDNNNNNNNNNHAGRENGADTTTGPSPASRRRALFAALRPSQADKSFIMLSSDLSSAASARASVGGDKSGTVEGSIAPVAPEPCRLGGQESALPSRRGSQ